jgi:hypothetical protein
MRDIDQLFARLDRSPFRRRFRLGARERAYLEAKGLDVVTAHAREFSGGVSRRPSPSSGRTIGT